QAAGSAHRRRRPGADHARPQGHLAVERGALAARAEEERRAMGNAVVVADLRDTVKRRATGAIAMLCFCAGCAVAQTYPVKPIRLIVPFPPGGGTDMTARAVAQKLTERWGQTVVTDNRGGANGTIGVDMTAKSPADGYTLTMISSSHAANVSLYSKLPYDLLRDLAPVIQFTRQPYA